MSGDSTEVKIARIEERLIVLVNAEEQAREGRKQQYQTLENINRALLALENRVKDVENQLNKASPTIDEFITIKHKVVGAGVMGKYLWAFGAVVLTTLFNCREAILSWLTKS